VRQLVDETHGVDQQGIAALLELEPAHGWIERSEQLVLDERTGGGQAVHQRRLAGVGIADESDDRIRHAGTPAAMQSAGLLDLAQAALERSDAFAHSAPVDLELSFARAASADPAAAETRQVRPLPGQARQQVLELSELDLQLAGLAVRPARED